MVARISKDPDALLDYAVDWQSEWLPEGDRVIAASAQVESGLTLSFQTLVSGVHVIWLDGGTVGQSYTVVSRITTEDGRRNDFTFVVDIRER